MSRSRMMNDFIVITVTDTENDSMTRNRVIFKRHSR